MQVNGDCGGAGQGADAVGQDIRRDVVGAGAHGRERGQVSVVQVQPVGQRLGARPVISGEGVREPLRLALIDADQAERLAQFGQVRLAWRGDDQRAVRGEDAVDLVGVPRAEDVPRSDVSRWRWSVDLVTRLTDPVNLVILRRAKYSVRPSVPQRANAGSLGNAAEHGRGQQLHYKH